MDYLTTMSAAMLAGVVGAGGLLWAQNAEAATQAAASKPASQVSDDFDSIIHQIWAGRKDHFRADFEKRMKAGDVYALYDIETYLTNLQTYAAGRNDLAIMDELAGIYLPAVATLQKDKDGYRKWIFTSRESYVAKEQPNLLGQEVKLCSAQGLFPVSGMLEFIARTPRDKRTAGMERFQAEFWQVVVHDHYMRYIPDISGRWKRLEKLTPAQVKRDGSDAVTDFEMWMLAGAVNVLAAHKADETIAPLAAHDKKALSDFVHLGSGLIKSRLTRSQLKDFAGKEVEGINFELGVYDEHPDHAYAGYTGEDYPTPADKSPAKNGGWDISHGRRFVPVFDTLHDNRDATGQTFPDDSVMKGLANQVAYGVFKGDLRRPVFANFMDGSNGWYRVGYAGREKFGYGPYKLSNSILDGGYGFWARYNPDVRMILLAFWTWAGQAQKDVDPVFMKYYGKAYFPSADSDQLLMFLPSIAQ